MKIIDIKNYLARSANCLPEQARLPKLSRNINVSVVIPAYNEEAYVGNLLKRLNLQSFDKNFEIIIVDNDSDDNTIDIIRSFQGKFPIYIIKEPKKGAGNARKAGIDEVVRRLYERDKNQVTERHFVALTDADTQPDKNWLSLLYQKLTSEMGSILISGNYHSDLKIDQRIQKVTGIKNYFRTFSLLSELLDKFVGQTRMRGPNSGFEIECYILAGGFRQPVDKDGNTAPRECFDLARRISAKDIPIQHFDHPIVASQRRKLFDIITGFSSYNITDKKSGRFLSTRIQENKLLERALSTVKKEKWVEYRHVILKRIVTNTLLYPISIGTKNNTSNFLGLYNWAEIINDARFLGLDQLENKWALKVANELIDKFNL